MMRECDPGDLILLQLLVSPFIPKSGILMKQLEVSEIELRDAVIDILQHGDRPAPRRPSSFSCGF